MWTTVAVVAALLLTGLVLFLLEMITPTFGVLAVAGVASLILAAWVAYGLSDTFGIIVGIGVVIAIPGYWYLLVKVLPNTPLGERLFLRQSRVSEVGSGTPEATGLKSLVGEQARTVSTLRPSGTIEVDGRRVTAMAEYGMIERDARVRIVRVSGMSVIVRAMNPEDVHEPGEAPASGSQEGQAGA